LAPSITTRIGLVTSSPRGAGRQQVTGDRGVLGGALGQGKGDLGAVDGDAQGDHTAVVGHPDPIHQERDQIQLRQVGGQ